jgi:hypothetical protein
VSPGFACNRDNTGPLCDCTLCWFCLTFVAPSPGRGFVAAVIGSSGKIQRKNNLDHPVHRAFDGVGAGDSKRGLLECGSMIIDVDSVQNILHARFINQEGAIRDEFWIVKGAKNSS